MKKIFSILCLALAIMTVSSCKKEKYVEIVNLTKKGTEFYYGERVEVWTGTEGDARDITYDWTCTGGYFYGSHTQHLFENLWIAPAEPGEYTVTATARNGGSSSSRSTTMNVKWYFFDEFQTSISTTGWTTTNATAVLSANQDPALSLVEFRPTGTLGARLAKQLDHHPLTIPFSMKTTLGWRTHFRAGQAIFIRLLFKQPLGNFNYPYLREIRWEYWPISTANNYRIRYELYTPATNTSQWSVQGNVLPAPPALIDPTQGRNTIFSAAEHEEKTLAFSVDADHVFHAHVNGQIWFQSNAIKEWLAYAKATYPGFEDPVGSYIEYTAPTLTAADQTPTRIFINGVYISTDGSILR